ncbi:MAG: histidine phosphatase family protein [Erythrobacter sp.]|uniref:histidine phosphatase family protein n=1 Tax=Erythrobacter sp. TaxID=1042 RepID=UPI0026146F6F|nr:histidine phosphatase family protein [Erythrobacter sp.]MDJ0977288.1 histidine phosphatase family protein [Erythrobacter sp.]
MALIFLRHSEPLIKLGVCYGQLDVEARVLSEVELSELSETLPQSLVRIDTSPLSRCAALAGRLAERLNRPLQIDPRLQEIDFGRREGCAWDDIPRGEIDDWAADVTGAKPYGGESVDEMTVRVRSYLDECPYDQADVLAVTHMGVVRCAHAAFGYEGELEMRLGYAQSMTFDAPPALIKAHTNDKQRSRNAQTRNEKAPGGSIEEAPRA